MDPLPHIVHYLSWSWNQNCTLTELKTVINIIGYGLDKHALGMQNISAGEEFSALVYSYPGMLIEWGM